MTLQKLGIGSIILMASVLCCFSSGVVAQGVTLVSVTAASAASNGDSGRSSVSNDGRFVAFESTASNLVEGDFNDRSDVFLRDRIDGTTTRISLSPTGDEMSGADPSISGDGRFVAFLASANLYLWDAEVDKTRILIQGATMAYPSISESGRYIALWSLSGLVIEDTNGHADIYRIDAQTGEIQLASIGLGSQSNDASYIPVSISANGRFVAYSSDATNLVGLDTNGWEDVFLSDLETGSVTRVSTNANGIQGNLGGQRGSVSRDGRYVAFASSSNNLVADDTNGFVNDVFVKDMVTRSVVLVSVSSDGTQADARSGEPAISANGQHIAFQSDATNLLGVVSGDAQNVYVRDLESALTSLVSVNLSGESPNGDSGSFNLPSISSDGRYVSFESSASDLVENDKNDTSDVFLFENQPIVIFTSNFELSIP